MMELSLIPWMVHLMAIMMGILIAEHLVYHWDLLMNLHLVLMRESFWAHLMMKCLELHLEMKMESHMAVMKEQNWEFQVNFLMFLMMV